VAVSSNSSFFTFISAQELISTVSFTETRGDSDSAESDSAPLSLMFTCGLARQASVICILLLNPRHCEWEWSVQWFRVPTAGALGGSDLAELVTAETYLMFP
jgi:hypothetical protein